jgi:hypothetical protein
MVGFALPLTFGIDLMRHYVTKTRPITPITYEWAGLFLQLVIFAVIAKLTVLYLEKSAKEQGQHYLQARHDKKTCQLDPLGHIFRHCQT